MRRTKKACKYGVSKKTGRCLKTPRKGSKRRCKHGVSKKGGKCLKRARRT